MKLFLRAVLTVVFVFIAVTAAYTLYTKFLVDYSMENLELALSAAQKRPDDYSKLSANVYRSLLDDLAVEEISREDSNMKDVALLEMASRSMGEAVEKAGHARARLYLTQTVEAKKQARHDLLKMLDRAYRSLRQFYEGIFRLLGYLSRQMSSKVEEPFEVSSVLLLTQAEEKEKEWKLDDAAELYRKFLKFYPNHPDRVFVAITLSQVLMKQQKYYEAERLLRGLALSMDGAEEYQLIARLLKKLETFKKNRAEISHLRNLLLRYPDETSPERQKIELGLALRHIQLYSFAEAQDILNRLIHSPDRRIRAKAKFYTAWIYKLQSQYDQGADLLLSLREEEGLEGDLGLGLDAQLADIYYQKNDKVSALHYYENLSAQVARIQGSEIAKEAWAALADSEAAVIAFVDLQDTEQGQMYLNRLRQSLPNYGEFSNLRTAIREASETDLRTHAFIRLRNGQVYEALDLFKKKVTEDPKDAWSHSGLATSYVLLADLFMAREHALLGFDLQPDEYTASILGYVDAYLKKNRDAVALYEAALSYHPGESYIPAEYNLACLYLKEKRYADAFRLLEPLETQFRGLSNPMRAKILNNLGCAFWGLGQHETAVDFFYQSLAVTPELVQPKANLDLILRGETDQRMNIIE